MPETAACPNPLTKPADAQLWQPEPRPNADEAGPLNALEGRGGSLKLGIRRENAKDAQNTFNSDTSGDDTTHEVSCKTDRPAGPVRGG